MIERRDTMSEKVDKLKWIDERIKIELEPLLDRVITNNADFELFERAYQYSYKRLSRAFGILMSLTTESKKVKSDVFYLFIYLGLVESLGNSVIDLIVLLLVANGKDFHIECQYTTPRIKHALSIQDLETEKVPLTTKLNFLRDNDLSFLASLVDTELRNTVAHLKFEIKNGKVYVRGKKGFRLLTRKDLEDILSKMVRGLIESARLINSLMEEKGVKPR
jgi:hypothetical protein